MLNKLSIASTVLALGLMSTGAFAQSSIIPGWLGGGEVTAPAYPVKAPGHNRYAPFEVSATPDAPAYGSGAPELRRWAVHNRYTAGAVPAMSAEPVYASGSDAAATRRNAVHNRYEN